MCVAVILKTEEVSPIEKLNLDLCGFFKYRMWFRKWTLLFINGNCILLVLRIKKMERIWKHGMILYCVKFVRYWKYCLDYLCSTVWRETAFHLFQDHLKKYFYLYGSLTKGHTHFKITAIWFSDFFFKEGCCFSLILFLTMLGSTLVNIAWFLWFCAFSQWPQGR